MNKNLLFLIFAVFFNFLSFSQSPLDGFIDQVTDCSSGCSDLTINFAGIQETSNYTVESIPFNPPSNFNGLSNQLFANTDDLWGDVVNIPFNFNFFNTDYYQLVVGANGAITFDTSLAGEINGWSFSESLPNNTNPTLADGNIFGAGHDMDPAASNGTHEIGYQFFGEAPFRYMVISFFNVAQFSTQCHESRTTQMIVLYETTNVIDVYLQDKPVCTEWNSGNAVIGIQNPAGTIAVVPPGRNTGAWAAQNEAWRFNPAGAATATTYSWFDENNSLINNDVSINVCPTTTETYTAEVEFNNTFGDPITITDSVIVYTTFVGATPDDIMICSDTENSQFDLTPQTNVITGGNTCSIVTYHESQADADNSVNTIAQPESYTNTINPQTIYVRIEDANTGSYDTDSFNLVVNLNPEAYISEIETCSNGLAAGIADFDLSELDLLVTNGNTNNDVVYYFEMEDANTETNPLPTLFTMTNPNEGTIHARVTDPVTGCFAIVQCYLNVSFGPGLEVVTLQVCEVDYDGFAIFDILEHSSQILNGQTGVSLTFFENETDANNNVNPIISPEAYTNIENPQAVIVRGEDSQGCYSTSVIELFVYEIPTAITPTPLLGCDYIDVNGGYGFDQFDLSSKDAEILGDLDPETFSVSYFETLADAQFDSNVAMSPYVNAIAYNQTLFARVYNNDYQNCYEIVELDLVVEYCPIECDSQLVNMSICNVFNYLFHYEHQDYDTPLTIVFNSGFVTNQELIVIDSDGFTNLNEATPYGNAGDLTGLTFTSTSGLIGFVLSENYFCNSGVPLDFDVYCTSEVGLIEVNAFTDENSNSVFDTSESLFSNGYFTYEVNNDGVINTVDSSSGSFVIANTVESNSYDITYNFYDEYQNCFDVTVPSFQDVSVTNGSTVVYDFPVVAEQPCDDLAVYLVPITSPRPGFYYENELVIVNNGITDIASGTVEFVVDPLITFVDAIVYNSPSYTITPTATGFTLDFTNLQSGEESYVTIELYCPTTLNIDDLVNNTATYTTTTNDFVPDNNTSVLTQTVIGSYDPNDKTESHGREIVITDFTTDDYLFYTVRFQNIGTAEAINIRIEDVLDSQLDYSSLRMLKSSHDYVLTQTNNQLTWQFDDVNLPSESQDEPNSHGYVHFKAKPNAGYAIGDIIANTASIYFDFNAPIITNAFQTEFVQTLSTSDFNQLGFSIYPNPAKNAINLNFSNNINETTIVKVFNLLGELIVEDVLNIQNNSAQVDVSKLSKGVYFVELNQGQNRMTQKLIIE